MSATNRSPQQMAVTLRRMSARLLLGGLVVLVAGLIVLLVVPDKAVAGWALVVLAVLDLALALVVRGQARRTTASATSQEP